MVGENLIESRLDVPKVNIAVIASRSNRLRVISVGNWQKE